ncbi:MAG: hypothetical protein F4236_06350 [Acidimicrobiia bacterium]|nr:hypothetical protein [Acidimicrobiia bacterium]MYE67761.1 hypothetical protein [Acidimicrobiia bacterium]
MELSERATGLMVGVGVGNLLGIPWEGKSRAWIAAQNPHGVCEITARGGFPDDDDLAQAILLAEACIAGEDLDLADLAYRFWAWGELNGAGMGGLTRRVLERYGGAYPRRELRNYARSGQPATGKVRPPQGDSAADAARLVWEESGRSSAGNGSVMRCGPVALRWMRDDAALARNSVVSAIVTHWDWRCVWSTLLADFAIAACLRDERITSRDLVERATAAIRASRGRQVPTDHPDTPPAAVRDVVEVALAWGARIEDLELDSGGIGFAPKTLGAVLWSACHPESFEDGLTAIVNAGGDTDSTAAPAGAALGARFGISGIPRRWRERVAEIRAWEAPIDAWIHRRPLEWYADRLLSLAE